MNLSLHPSLCADAPNNSRLMLFVQNVTMSILSWVFFPLMLNVFLMKAMCLSNWSNRNSLMFGEIWLFSFLLRFTWGDRYLMWRYSTIMSRLTELSNKVWERGGKLEALWKDGWRYLHVYFSKAGHRISASFLNRFLTQLETYFRVFQLCCASYVMQYRGGWDEQSDTACQKCWSAIFKVLRS